MSFVKIMLHCVWRTKNGERILSKDNRLILQDHILENAKNKGIYIDIIGGDVDHLHCLISLGAIQNISEVIKLIKGESAHWANKQSLLSHKLEWAEDYFAASVSESAIEKVREYISNQEEHHKKTTFTQEYNKFMKAYGFKLG